MIIDLHTHSTFSDGDNDPYQLVLLWEEAGLNYASLNDHDTIEGIEFAEQASLGLKVNFIPGIEIGCRGRFHILGEGVNPGSRALRKYSECQRENHKRRARIALDCLKKIGFATNQSILKKRRGIISTHEIFMASNTGLSSSEFAKRYIYKGSPYHVKIERMVFKEAIELIHEAEGIAIWAHPAYTFRKDLSKIESSLAEMRKAGLDGIEVFSSKHDEEQTILLHDLALKYSLPQSAGSDYHGHGTRKLAGYETYGLPFDPEEIIKIIKNKTAANIN